MNLPIVQRELLVASRGLASWLWRWIVAIVAVAFGGLWLLFASIGQSAGPGLQGGAGASRRRRCRIST